MKWLRYVQKQLPDDLRMVLKGLQGVSPNPVRWQTSVRETRTHSKATITETTDDFAKKIATGVVEATYIDATGIAHPFGVAPGQRILDAARDRGIDMPFSCTAGGCGACRVTLTQGEVVMQTPNCLRDEEKALNQILSCSSFARLGQTHLILTDLYYPESTLKDG